MSKKARKREKRKALRQSKNNILELAEKEYDKDITTELVQSAKDSEFEAESPSEELDDFIGKIHLVFDMLVGEEVKDEDGNKRFVNRRVFDEDGKIVSYVPASHNDPFMQKWFSGYETKPERLNRKIHKKANEMSGEEYKATADSLDPSVMFDASDLIAQFKK